MYRAALLSLLVIAVSAAPCIAAEPASVIVVFDGSGSMWGKPEGESKSKLVLMRDALKEGLTKLPAETRLGLMSYGHRRAGDCNDFETIVKPQSGSLERVAGALEKLNPKGRGPITATLREAAKELGTTSAPSNVILIHDDLDNCQLDPCSALDDLRRTNPKVAVHVVSVAMKREDALKMQCLAKGSGGTHNEAATAQAAAAAIEAIVKTLPFGARREPPAQPPAGSAPTPPPALAPMATKPGLQLSASLAEGSPFLDVPIRWRVALAAPANAPPFYEGDAAAPFLELPSGRYAIEAQFGFVVARSAVDVVAGTAHSVVLPLGAGTVQLATTIHSSPSSRSAVISFTRTDLASDSSAILRGIVPEVALVPGAYRVSATIGAVRIGRPVTVTAGQRSPLLPLLNFGEVEIQVVATSGTAPVDNAVITVYEDDPDAPLGRREIVRSAANGGTFALPAGTYYVVARQGAVETRDRFAVKSGESERKTLLLDFARVLVSAKLTGRVEIPEPVSLRLERLDEPKENLQSNRQSAEFDVPPGRYRIKARIGLANVKGERELELKAGAREQIAIELPAGSVKLRLLDPAAGLPLPDVAWEIRDRSGTVVWLANQTEARPLLLQGRYSVKAESRSLAVTRDVEIRSGDARTIDLRLP